MYLVINDISIMLIQHQELFPLVILSYSNHSIKFQKGICLPKIKIIGQMWAWPCVKVICSTHLSIIQSPVQHLLLCGLAQLVSLVLGLGGQVLPLAVQVLQDPLHLIWWGVFFCHQRLARLKRTWYVCYCWLLAHWCVTLCEKVTASLTESPIAMVAYYVKH